MYQRSLLKFCQLFMGSKKGNNITYAEEVLTCVRNISVTIPLEPKK